MTNESLAKSYLRTVSDRLKVLDLLISEQAYSDVCGKFRKFVALALKGMLRAVGIEPPRLPNVGELVAI